MFLFIFGVIGIPKMLGWLRGNKKHYIFQAGLQVTPQKMKKHNTICPCSKITTLENVPSCQPSLVGCLIPLRTLWDKRGSLGVQLYQKDPKSVKKWLSHGHFPPERLCDSIENQIEQKGIFWCSVVPKRSKICQEMAELGLLIC